MSSPIIRTVVGNATPNTAESLQSLLGALTGTAAVVNLRPAQHCCDVKIHADLNGGAAKFFVGNSNVTDVTTNAGMGIQFSAGQTYELGPFSSNLLKLNDIFVCSDTASVRWDITVVVR